MNAPGRGSEGFEDIRETPPRGDSGQPVPAGGGSDIVRTSRLAVAGCVLAIVSLLLLPGLIRIFMISHGREPLLVHEVYQHVTFVVSILAVVLTIASLARISLSAGRLAGRGFAWTGAALMTLQVLYFLAVLGGTRCVAFRMTCGANLAGIGKAMLIYANDYEGELPCAGGRNGQWTSRTPDWKAPDPRTAYGLAPDGTGGKASISASLYLLVKYCEVPPKRFICGGSSRKTREKGMKEFRLGIYRVPDKRAELIDFWDFGPDPARHVSYAYQMVYGPYKLTISGEPGMAIAADRNPWMDSPSTKAGDFSQFRPDTPPFGGSTEQAHRGNTLRHDTDGQNVLFLDSHVEFAKRAYCSVEDDNIYTISQNPAGGDPLGVPPPADSTCAPANRKDSVLVNDPIPQPRVRHRD